MELSWSLSHSWNRTDGSWLHAGSSSLLLPHLNIKAPALQVCILSQQFPGSLSSSHSALDYPVCLCLFSYLRSFSLWSLKYLCVFESRTSQSASVFPRHQWCSPEDVLVCSLPLPTCPMSSVPRPQCHALLGSPCRPCLPFFPFLQGSHAV